MKIHCVELSDLSCSRREEGKASVPLLARQISINTLPGEKSLAAQHDAIATLLCIIRELPHKTDASETPSQQLFKGTEVVTLISYSYFIKSESY